MTADRTDSAPAADRAALLRALPSVDAVRRVADATTSEIRAVLEESLARWPDHPALCHLYIHTMEAGPEVGRAVPVAETLETLTPGLGHLIHMPSHIYTWTGRYDDVIRVNQRAVEVD